MLINLAGNCQIDRASKGSVEEGSGNGGIKLAFRKNSLIFYDFQKIIKFLKVSQEHVSIT